MKVNDANKLLKCINNNTLNNDYSKYSKVYSFTTENIGGYFSQIDFFNKKILTVCSSGDHILNAILMGCKSIDCFDTNILTKYYMELKIGAIKTLDFYEFQQFFMSTKMFNYDLYEKIRTVLNDDIKLFWNYVYENIDINVFIKKFFIKSDYKKTNKFYNLYFDLENYDKLKNILLSKKININFHNSNVLELNKKVKAKYDYIFLSNIIDYLNCNKNISLNYLEFLQNTIMKKFNSQMIFWSYIYNSPKKDKVFFNNVYYVDFENKYISGQMDSISIIKR